MQNGGKSPIGKQGASPPICQFGRSRNWGRLIKRTIITVRHFTKIIRLLTHWRQKKPNHWKNKKRYRNICSSHRPRNKNKPFRLHHIANSPRLQWFKQPIFRSRRYYHWKIFHCSTNRKSKRTDCLRPTHLIRNCRPVGLQQRCLFIKPI